MTNCTCTRLACDHFSLFPPALMSELMKMTDDQRSTFFDRDSHFYVTASHEMLRVDYEAQRVHLARLMIGLPV